MAEVYGTNYNKYIAPTPGNQMGAEYDGRVIAEADTYTCNATAANTTIDIGYLRPGEVFMYGYIAGANLGASTTISVGDSGNAARYLAVTNCNAAFSAVMAPTGGNGIGYKNNGSTTLPIFATVAGGNTTGRFDTVIFKARQ
jgi:hypothetical protein